MTYEDQVIEAARVGLSEGLFPMTKELEKLLRMVFQAGHKQGIIDTLEKQIKSLE